MKLSFTILLFFLCTYTFTQVKSQIIDKRDGRWYKTVLIDNNTWMLDNLNASEFQNGDKIPTIMTYKEWVKACNNKQPACCYFNNKKKNGKQYGRLYNWYAINDPRGLAPEGMIIPSEIELAALVNYFCNVGADRESSDWTLTENCNNSSVFKLTQSLNITSSNARINGSFIHSYGCYIWSTSVYNEYDAISIWISNKMDNLKVMKSPKLDAYSVRCMIKREVY